MTQRDKEFDTTSRISQQNADTNTYNAKTNRMRAVTEAERVQLNAILREQDLYSKTSLGKLRDLQNFFRGIGYSADDAATLAIRHTLEKMGVIKEPSKREQAVTNYLNNVLDVIEKGDIAGAGKLYNGYINPLNAADDPIKLLEGISEQANNNFNRKKAALEEFFENVSPETGETDRAKAVIKLQTYFSGIDNGKTDKEINDEYQLRIRNPNHNKDNNKNNTEIKKANENVRAKLTENKGSSGGGTFSKNQQIYDVRPDQTLVSR